MAFTPFTLPKQTKLFRTTPSGQQMSIEVPAGTVVHREDTETETDRFLTLRWRHDGFTWERLQRSPKVPDVVETPNGQTVPKGCTCTPVVVNGSPRHNKHCALIVERQNGSTIPVINGSAAVPVLAMVPTPLPPSTPTVAFTPVSQQTSAAVTASANAAEKAVNLLVRRRTIASDEEREVRSIQREVDILRGKVYQLNYYIPDTMKKAAGTRHLTVFRKHAFRFDGSNWVIPQHGLDHKDVQAIFKHWDSLKPKDAESKLPGWSFKDGVEKWVIEYSPEQIAAMREQATSRLQRALIKLHTSLIERIDSASESLKKAQEEAKSAYQRDKALSKRDATIRSAVREAIERFESCLKGAEIFDDTGSLDHLFGAVREAVQVQALCINAILQARHVKQVKIPTSIMANPPGHASIGNGPSPR